MDVTTHTISPLLRFTSYFAPLFLLLCSNSPNSSHLCNASLTSLFLFCFLSTKHHIYYPILPALPFFLLPFRSLSSPYPCPNSSSPLLLPPSNHPIYSLIPLSPPNLLLQHGPESPRATHFHDDDHFGDLHVHQHAGDVPGPVPAMGVRREHQTSLPVRLCKGEEKIAR